MKKRAPRCLGVNARPASDDLRMFLQAQAGEDSPVFTPLCECEHEFLQVASSQQCSPTSISCTCCGRSRVVFDPTKHGYDGELGHNTTVRTAPPEEMCCLACGGKTFQVALCFQYSGETDVLDYDDPPAVRPEDLFGWVIVAAQCAECLKVQKICEYECA